jgi:hypothetical protein
MTKLFKSLVPKPAKRRAPQSPGRQPTQPVDREKLEQAARARDADASAAPPATDETAGKPKEIGGPDGPEPTRYGDWERGGICYDF